MNPVNAAIQHGRELAEKLEPVGNGKNGRLYKPLLIRTNKAAQSKANKATRKYS